MQLHSVRLTNFRQHEATELTFGSGLTGIVGPNGSGKTTILEGLAWALYGTPAARGSRDSIRRRGAPPRSRVEVQVDFSLGPHRYRVVRSLNGAELYQDGGPEPVANSIGAVTDRITRLLGMNREEFFNTYFTGQKELAIMGAMTPSERSQFLSRVLGYERLREAQLLLKERRSVLRARHETITESLPSADALAEDARRVEVRLEAAKARLEASIIAHTQAEALLVEVGPRWAEMQQRQEQVRSLESDLRVAEHQVSDARDAHQKLDLELAEAITAQSRLAELQPALGPLPALLEERGALDRAAEALASRRTQMGQLEELRAVAARMDERLTGLPDASALEGARAAMTAAQAMLKEATELAENLRTAWVSDTQEARTRHQQLQDQYRDIKEQVRVLEDLGPEGVCPTCNRALGEEFGEVLSVLKRQMKEMTQNGTWYRQRVKQLEKEPKEVTEARATRERLDGEASARRTELTRIEGGLQDRQRITAERAKLAERVASLEAGLGEAAVTYDERRHAELRALIADLEPKALVAERLRGAAERAERLTAQAAALEASLSQRETRVRELREQLQELGWSADAFEAARQQFQEAEKARREAETAQARADAEVHSATEAKSGIERRKAERDQRLEERAVIQRDLLLNQELDKALADLRTDLNATLRPDLSDLASGLLRDLTGARYTDLELDEDYVARIVDDGEPLQVISGGEEDVVNLALRLGISQMIAERAGQPLALLVLDEIFGSLDEDRRAGVMDLLRHLADRFPQVILITHIESVREGFDRVIRIAYDHERGVSSAREEPVEPAHAA